MCLICCTFVNKGIKPKLCCWFVLHDFIAVWQLLSFLVHNAVYAFLKVQILYYNKTSQYMYCNTMGHNSVGIRDDATRIDPIPTQSRQNVLPQQLSNWPSPSACEWRCKNTDLYSQLTCNTKKTELDKASWAQLVSVQIYHKINWQHDNDHCNLGCWSPVCETARVHSYSLYSMHR